MASTSATEPTVETLQAEVQELQEKLNGLGVTVDSAMKGVEGPVGSGVELQDYKKQMLKRLRQIRDTLVSEDSSVEKLKKERDEAVAERDALKKQVEKLNYRVDHLKAHIVVNPPSN